MADEIPIPLGNLTDHETIIVLVRLTNANTINIAALTKVVADSQTRLGQIDTRCEERHSQSPIPARVESFDKRVLMVLTAVSSGIVAVIMGVGAVIAKIAGWW